MEQENKADDEIQAFLSLFDEKGEPKKGYIEKIEKYSNQELFDVIAKTFKVRPMIHNFQETPFENIGGAHHKFSMIELLLDLMQNGYLSGDQVDVLHKLYYDKGVFTSSGSHKSPGGLGGISEEFNMLKKTPTDREAIKEIYDMYQLDRPMGFMLDLYLSWRLVGKLFVKILKTYSLQDAIAFLNTLISIDQERGCNSILERGIVEIFREIRTLAVLPDVELNGIEKSFSNRVAQQFKKY